MQSEHTFSTKTSTNTSTKTTIKTVDENSSKDTFDKTTAINPLQYDARSRKLLSNRRLLAYLLKNVCHQFSNYEISEILPCIDSHIHLADVPLNSQNYYTPDRIIGDSEADKDPAEGNVFFDLKFTAHVPENDITLIVNVESQNNFRPGYPIFNRALFYVSR